MPSAEPQSIQTQIAKFLSNVFNIEVPSAKTDLFETGVLDSQRFVELLLYIEQKFETEITVEDFEPDNFRSVEKIQNLILRHKNMPT